MGKLRPRLTFANVVSVIALFVALGGASYAAVKLPKNSVGAKQLTKNAITTAKIKNEAVTAAKVKKGTLTGSQINLASLGTVPAATNATNAVNASNATNATNAVNASNATNAKHAQIADAIQAPEALHLVGEPGVPFAPHWKNFGPPNEYAAAAFYMDREGVVHIQGTVAGNGTSQHIFTLPPAYRPASIQDFAVVGNGGTLAAASVNKSGEVQSSDENLVHIDGITFRAGQ